jgi:hypothetical protein
MNETVILSCLFFLFFSSVSMAQELPFPENTKEIVGTKFLDPKENQKEEPVAEDSNVKEFTASKESHDNRQDSTFSILWNPFSYLSLVVPKWGLQVGWILSKNWSIEPEYQSGSFGLAISKFDVGKISEKNIILPFRRYIGNSFNLRFGPGYHSLEVDLGDKWLSKVSREKLHLNLVKISAYVINLGFGNRWQLDNGISLGADWFEISIPVHTKMDEQITQHIPDENDRKNALNALKVLRYFPSTTVFKLQLGYAF